MATTRTENHAWCIDCDWTFDGPKADTEARKHTETENHATVANMRPIEPPKEVKP